MLFKRKRTNQGRFEELDDWHSPMGMVTHPMAIRLHDVQPLTGRTVSRVPQGRWVRGILLRASTPELALPDRTSMYDATNPQHRAAGIRLR